MKAVRAIIERLTMGRVLAFGLTSNLHAQPVPPEDTNNYPPPTQEELEAAYQAWLAQLATNRESVLPYLHSAQTLPDGSWSNATGEINAIKPTVAAELPFNLTNPHRFYRLAEVE